MGKTYCLAICANTLCTNSKYFMPQHGNNATADFSNRCKDHKPVPEKKP